MLPFPVIHISIELLNLDFQLNLPGWVESEMSTLLSAKKLVSDAAMERVR
jgi:hypothetical protein